MRVYGLLELEKKSVSTFFRPYFSACWASVLIVRSMHILHQFYLLLFVRKAVKFWNKTYNPMQHPS